MQVAYEITFWHWTALCLLLLVDDSFWEVSAAEDMPVGMRVKILTLEHDQIFRVERQ
ncbi:MAG: hypothetical protein IPK95_05045 [Cellvibrionales bacterium]|nr:hypothetical protein [Cellvibrionales bacterium]